MMDLVKGPPELRRLIEMVLEYNMKVIGKWLEIGVDVISFETTLGLRIG